MSQVVVAKGYVESIHWGRAVIVYNITDNDEFDAAYDGDGEAFEGHPAGSGCMGEDVDSIVAGEDDLDIDIEVEVEADMDTKPFRETRPLSIAEYREVCQCPLFLVLSDSETGKSSLRWTDD